MGKVNVKEMLLQGKTDAEILPFLKEAYPKMTEKQLVVMIGFAKRIIAKQAEKKTE